MFFRDEVADGSIYSNIGHKKERNVELDGIHRVPSQQLKLVLIINVDSFLSPILLVDSLNSLCEAAVFDLLLIREDLKNTKSVGPTNYPHYLMSDIQNISLGRIPYTARMKTGTSPREKVELQIIIFHILFLLIKTSSGHNSVRTRHVLNLMVPPKQS